MCLYFKMQFLFLRDPDPHIAPPQLLQLPFIRFRTVSSRASNEPSRKLREVLQSQRRPVLALSHVRHYFDTMLNCHGK